METYKLYFKMLENGIEELRTEKYQQEKNGIAKALMATLEDLQNEVKKLTIPNVSTRIECEHLHVTNRICNKCKRVITYVPD